MAEPEEEGFEPDEEPKSYRNIKGRTWFLTWNNYTQKDFDNIKAWIEKSCESFVLGKEVGKKKGTPHIQGCFKFKNGRTWDALVKIWKKIYLKPARNWAACVNYCLKGGDYIEKNIDDVLKTNTKPPRNGRPAGRHNGVSLQPEHEVQYNNYCKEVYDNVKWKPWQGNILSIIESKPSERKVYWYWEETGNIGKSFLCKYLDWKYDAIIANGKQADIFNQYKVYLTETGKQPTIALIDIPRSHKDFVCYSTLEKIKDGLIYSGKYEGGKCRLIPHHLIILANFEPDLSKLSEDRWVITNLAEPN